MLTYFVLKFNYIEPYNIMLNIVNKITKIHIYKNITNYLHCIFVPRVTRYIWISIIYLNKIVVFLITINLYNIKELL